MLLKAVPKARAGENWDSSGDMIIAASRIQARRRWVFRTALLLSVSAMALCLLVAVRRDQMTKFEQMRSIEPVVAALQTQVTRLGQLPATLPDMPSRAQLSYAPEVVRDYAKATSEPVIVACTARQSLVVLKDGNCVVLLEDGELRAEWWDRLDFVAAWTAQTSRVDAWEEARRQSLPNLP